MSMFGWSLPPGCGALPGDDDAGPCDVCGGYIDVNGCICPECPECGAQGDFRCYQQATEWAPDCLSWQPLATNPDYFPAFYTGCSGPMVVSRYQLALRHIREVAWEAEAEAEAEAKYRENYSALKEDLE